MWMVICLLLAKLHRQAEMPGKVPKAPTCPLQPKAYSEFLRERLAYHQQQGESSKSIHLWNCTYEILETQVVTLVGGLSAHWHDYTSVIGVESHKEVMSLISQEWQQVKENDAHLEVFTSQAKVAARSPDASSWMEEQKDLRVWKIRRKMEKLVRTGDHKILADYWNFSAFSHSWVPSHSVFPQVMNLMAIGADCLVAVIKDRRLSVFGTMHATDFMQEHPKDSSTVNGLLQW